MPQRFLMHVPFDSDARKLAGILDEAKVESVRGAHFSIE